MRRQNFMPHQYTTEMPRAFPMPGNNNTLPMYYEFFTAATAIIQSFILINSVSSTIQPSRLFYAPHDTPTVSLE